MRKFFIVLILLIIGPTVILASANGITVSIAPLAEFVEKVGGDYVNVSIMVPPGSSPHQYEPSPGQMQKLRADKLFVKAGSGIEFELVWLDKILKINPHITICNGAQNIEFIKHQDEGHDHHHETDPHIWLSPYNAIQIVTTIKDALIQMDPTHKPIYENNAQQYTQKLTQLINALQTEFSKLKNSKFIVFHPAWAYFARDFNLEQIAVAKEGKEPSAKDIANLIKLAQKETIKIVFASPQFSQKSAKTIANELGGAVVLIDPLAKDYLANLRQVAEALVEANQ